MSLQNLGDVVDIIGGGTPSKKVAAYYGGDIPWATVRDMNTDLIAKTDQTITIEGLKNSSSKLIPKDEVVIATRVGLGKVCLLNQDTAINQDLRGLIPKSRVSLDRKYLFYWYKSIAEQVEKAGTGATVKGVRLPFIKALQIPLPPLEEQRRIVAILDQLQGDKKRQPRILFLADRNILADQAYGSFSGFSEDARMRINPKEIRKRKGMPKNANVFFQSFRP